MLITADDVIKGGVVCVDSRNYAQRNELDEYPLTHTGATDGPATFSAVFPYESKTSSIN